MNLTFVRKVKIIFDPRRIGCSFKFIVTVNSYVTYTSALTT